ncbi:hypothetical protein [Helicobacter ganmani]
MSSRDFIEVVAHTLSLRELQRNSFTASLQKPLGFCGVHLRFYPASL